MASVPVCSLRETLAFLRNPAVFTAGPGQRLGNLYRVRRPGRRLHVVTDPQLAEEILVGQAACFEKSRIYWHELRRSMGESLGTLEGDRWEYLHDLQRPYFTAEAVRGYLPAVAEQARLQFQALIQGPGARVEIPLLELFAELNARAVVAVLFGQDGDPACLEIARRIADGHAIVAWRAKFPWRRVTGWLSGANWRARRHRQWLGRYADRVRESPAASDPSRLLYALARAETDPAAPRFSGSLLRSEITFHLGAGTETLATATAWTLYLLRGHPPVLEKLRDELSSQAGRAAVSSAHVESLDYARQVIQEALRLFPPVYGILRDCVRPVELRGCALRRGDAFLISVVGLHRNPRLWDDPEGFRPDRFESQSAGAIPRYQYLPFGAGKHACIGRHLALPAMVLTVAQFVQQFDWDFLDPHVTPVATSSLKPSGALVARLTPRTSAPDLAG